ncbi:hypothetical protein ABB37_09619 [Leptomonas pyrrhocoris]|uniref:Transmembrane protein n=1 Tax=Leptomonas pyrrhocoris TaxID=157538 RepID=A0A0M9FPY9_LEPPY|nr:hypothetical protein ABB37_09619 [Leptomonas pyrrhocoris]KPA73690.1 hypothetical protein ABB37_09619 [Leptomonas pyrrhocoris]|eukprot:XP_015652129.1 hypothetical protein ABB37_09619 [Leptomonas pyrrhocoris]
MRTSLPCRSCTAALHARRQLRLAASVIAPRGAACCSSSLSSSSTSVSALGCCTSSFYDKIREKRDGSDDGPEQMFEDFAKSPRRQRMPAELHKSNKEAVDRAEYLNRIFSVFLLFVLGGSIYFIDPFNGDQYSRPEGYGVTDPKNVYGSSDRAGGPHGRQ